MKILALDYGTKHIGLATGDLEIGIAFPRDVFENKEGVAGKICALCEELGVKKVIVGMPLSMEEGQKENSIVGEVKGFVKELEEKLFEEGVEIELFDERLSSFEAERLTGKSARKGGERLDAHAAQIILQRWFDKN